MQAIIVEKNKKLAELRLKKEILELQHEIASRRNNIRNGGGLATQWRDAQGKSTKQIYQENNHLTCTSKLRPETSYLNTRLDDKKTEVKQCLQKSELTKSGQNNVENVDAKISRIEKELKASLVSQRQELQSSLTLIQNKLKSQSAELLREVEGVKRYSEQKVRESVLSVKQEFEYTSIEHIDSTCSNLHDELTQQLVEVKAQLQQEFRVELDAARDHYETELKKAKRALQDDFRKELAKVKQQLDQQFTDKVKDMRAREESDITVKMESLLGEVQQQYQSELAYLRQLHKMEMNEKVENMKIEWELRHRNLESKLQNVKAIQVDQVKSAATDEISDDVNANNFETPNMKVAGQGGANQTNGSFATTGSAESTGDSSFERVPMQSDSKEINIEGQQNKQDDKSLVAYDIDLLFSRVTEKKQSRCVCRFVCIELPHKNENCVNEKEETNSMSGQEYNIHHSSNNGSLPLSAHQKQEDVEHESCFSDDDMDMATMVDSFVDQDPKRNNLLQSRPYSENQAKASLLDRFFMGSPKKCSLEELWQDGDSESSDQIESAHFSTQENDFAQQKQPLDDMVTEEKEDGSEESEEMDEGDSERSRAAHDHEDDNDLNMREFQGISTNNVARDTPNEEELFEVAERFSFDPESTRQAGLRAFSESGNDSLTHNTCGKNNTAHKCLREESCAEINEATEEMEQNTSSGAKLHDTFHNEKLEELNESTGHVLNDCESRPIVEENDDYEIEVDFSCDTPLHTNSKSDVKFECNGLTKEELEVEKDTSAETGAISQNKVDTFAAGEDDSCHSEYGASVISRNSENSGTQFDNHEQIDARYSSEDESEVGSQDGNSSISDQLFVEVHKDESSNDLNKGHTIDSLSSVERNECNDDCQIFTAQADEYELAEEVSEVDFSDSETNDELEAVPYQTDFLHKLPSYDMKELDIAAATEVTLNDEETNNDVMNTPSMKNDVLDYAGYEAKDAEVEEATMAVVENDYSKHDVSEVNSEDDVLEGETEREPFHLDAFGSMRVDDAHSTEDHQQSLQESDELSAKQSKNMEERHEFESSMIEDTTAIKTNESSEAYLNNEQYYDNDDSISTADEQTGSDYSEEEYEEEEDCSSTGEVDGLVPAEKLNIEDEEEMELRRKALALLGVGI